MYSNHDTWTIKFFCRVPKVVRKQTLRSMYLLECLIHIKFERETECIDYCAKGIFAISVDYWDVRLN